jgi:putative transposase
VADLEITRPFQVLPSDITFIHTGAGFKYLCKIRDVIIRIVLAQSIKDHKKAELMMESIHKMMKRWDLPSGCICTVKEAASMHQRPCKI